MRLGDFELYKDILYERSGLVITPDKSYLLDSRLTPVAKKWNFMSIELMTLQLRALPDADLLRDVVEAMTVGETSFYRDSKPFIDFQKIILPYLTKNRAKKSLRIWSAAASSGQEPYSIAMMLKENEALLKGWKIEIIATDLSEEALQTAKRGLYTQFDIQKGVPTMQLMKYFDQINEKWHIRKELRSMIQFEQFNLLDDMTHLGMFDVILCRNVIGNFDQKTQADVLDRMSSRLDKDGYLILGAEETALGVSDKFAALPDRPQLFVHAGMHGSSTAETAAKRA